MSNEIKAVWVILDKKKWGKGKKDRLLHGCWLHEENAEIFAKKTYGDDWGEWALVTPLLISENNTLEKTLSTIFQRPECVFTYCPSPDDCKKQDTCYSKTVK
jgi:hypothetical protein